MSHKIAHTPPPPDRRMAIFPNGSRPHVVRPPFKHFNFQPIEDTPDHVLPISAFVPNIVGTNAAENYKIEDRTYEATPGAMPSDDTMSFKSATQNVYALAERTEGSAATHRTLQLTYAALDEYWQGVDASGEQIDRDNVATFMEGALQHVKDRLVSAGESNLSTGMTMLKFFKQDEGWGMAVAHVGNTTHGFATNKAMPRLQGHGHTSISQKGRVMDLTQPQFDPHTPKKLRKSGPEKKQTSLNSDPNQQVLENVRVSVTPQIPIDTKIVLCNDKVIGSLVDEIGHKPQTIAEREKAILKSASSAEIAQKLFASKNHPGAAALIIELSKPVNLLKADRQTAAPTETEPPTPTHTRLVLAMHRVAHLLREFATSDTEEMRKRRRQAAETLAAIAVAGAAIYIGKHRFPEQTEELIGKVKRAKAAKKAGQLARSASERSKAAAKRGKEAVKTSGAVKKATELSAKHVPKAVETIRASRIKPQPATVAPEHEEKTVPELVPIVLEPTKRSARIARAKKAAEAAKTRARTLSAQVATQTRSKIPRHKQR